MPRSVRTRLVNIRNRRHRSAAIEPLELRRMLATGAVAGTVFMDSDGNGSNVGPIGGAIVYADLDLDGVLDTGEPSSVNSITNGWRLDLEEGSYLLRCKLPAGYQLSFPADQIHFVSTQAGFIRLGVNFGAWRTGDYGVNFYRDRNGNGTFDGSGGDFLAPAQTIWADLDNDGVMDDNEPAASSDYSGFGKISLRPGTHTLRFTKPPEWTFTNPASGSASATFESGIGFFPQYVGMTGPSIAEGIVFNDLNGDRKRDVGEGPIAGVTAFIDHNGNARLDPAETNVTTTDADGLFRLVGPFPNSSSICVIDPLNPTGPAQSSAVFSLGTDTEFVLFNSIRPNARLAGHLYVDADASGTYNSGDRFLPGRPVYADLNDNAAHDPGEPMTITMWGGQYELNGPAGSYRIRTLEGDDYTFGASGGASQVLNVSGRGSFSPSMIGMIDNRPSRGKSGITGYSFRDDNRNGRYDPGEEPNVGRTIYADANGNGAFEAGESSAVSDSAGYYSITSLASNTSYDVREIVPAGWEATKVGNRGVPRINFGASAAVSADTNVGSRPVPPLVKSATFLEGDGQYLQKIRVEFNRDISKTLGEGDFVLYNLSFGVMGNPLLWDFEQAVENGVTVATLKFSSLLPDYYRLVLPAGSVADAAQNALREDFEYEFFQVRGTNSANHYVIRPGAGGMAEFFLSPQSPTPRWTVPMAQLDEIFIQGSGGDDSFEIDASIAAATKVTFLGQSGSDTIKITGGAGAEHVTFAAGEITIGEITIGEGTAGEGVAGDGGAGEAATIIHDAEHATFDGNGGGDPLTVTGGPTVTLLDTQHLAALDIAAGAVVAIPPGAGATLFASNLAIAGRLDLADNKMIVAGSSIAAIESLVISARNGGAWNGNGIVTTMPPAATGLTTLGVGADGANAIVKYTYAGDANLDGFISGDDYTAIDFAIATPGASGYGNGDFNYDGFISGDDYTVIDFNIVAQGAPLSAATTVPEGSATTPAAASDVPAAVATAWVAAPQPFGDGEAAEDESSLAAQLLV